AARRSRRAYSPSAAWQLETPQDDANTCCCGAGWTVLILILLLEISLRMELAKEASDAAIDVTSAPSARPQKMEFGDAFPTQPTGSILLQSVEQLPGAQPSSDYGQTFGQVFQEPVPLPRSRKPR